MATLPDAVRAFWSAFAQAQSGVDESRFYDVCVFGDSAALADELAALVLCGTKRATAGSVASYQDQGIRPPQVGDLSIVTTWAGEPVCVIETTATEVLPFADVDEVFAATEGEGDGSLAYWREAHRAFFSRECEAAGRSFSEDMLLVCERFRVVYPLPRD